MADNEFSGEPDNPKSNENKNQRGYSMKINKHGNRWIFIMKIIAWFGFFGTILLGIRIANQYFSKVTGMYENILIFTIIFAFTSIATLMIFLNMAKDISIIRQILQNKNE